MTKRGYVISHVKPGRGVELVRAQSGQMLCRRKRTKVQWRVCNQTHIIREHTITAQSRRIPQNLDGEADESADNLTERSEGFAIRDS